MKSRRPRQQNRAQVSNISIPYQKAIQLTQTSTKTSTIITAQELIGNITIGPNSNNVFAFLLNPVDAAYRGTRLQQLAGSFEKFRFRRIAFRVMTNLPTTVGGTLTTGFCENPDQGIPETAAAAQQAIFALNGANISNLWVHNFVRCNIIDKNKWYNVDPDSTETMMTTQGVVYLLPSSDINITIDVEIPVVLDYQIEFMGSAKQTLPGLNNFYLAMDFTQSYVPSTITGLIGPTDFWISDVHTSAPTEFNAVWDKYHNSTINSPSNFFEVSPRAIITNTVASNGDTIVVKSQIMTSVINSLGTKYFVVRFFNQSGLLISQDPAFTTFVAAKSTWVYTTSSPSLANRRLNLVRALNQ